MKDVFRRLLGDFFSTIVFLVAYSVSGNIVVATSVGVAGAIGQYALAKWRGQHLDLMALASVGLVVVLGSVTIATSDPRFVLAKPAIAHFAIGSIMLRRNWMLRYMPPIVRQYGPDLILAAGYCWAALMFALGLGTIAVATTGDLKLWALFTGVVSTLANVAAFGIQYVVFRTVIRRRVRAQATVPVAGAAPAAAQ